MGRAALSATIRTLGPADLSSVSEIFGWYAVNSVATFEEAPRPLNEWHALHAALDELGLPFLVAEQDGMVAGYAYAGPWRRKPAYRHTVEDSVFIAPQLTGRGIGRQLLAGLLTASASAGARQMIAVIADTGDDASVGLHAAFGFAHVGRLTAVGYKHGRWIDTLLMQRQLA
ncbi:MAG TPA: GNAT family N-acetyltransferase [Streptosporangiaceae bacterium]|nr:GNAT family N-acetyltransferase [Streptosporangiaceae bacterium]